MSHLDLALRRAMMEGTLKASATVLDTQPAPDADTAHRTFPSEAPAAQEDRPARPAGRARDRRSWHIDSRLPPAVVGQLGSLADSLAAHPAAPRVIGFVSPGRGEGTSTCVAAFGVYLASRHSAILVVDANYHHPALHTIAGIEQSPGLAELVAGEIDLAQAPHPTNIPELFVLPSGTTDPRRRNGALGRSALRDRLAEYLRRFDLVLVDCPAVNPNGDAASMAAACDAVVLVVEGGRTKREAAQAAKALLTRSNCTIVGAFMNRRRFYIPQFFYDRL